MKGWRAQWQLSPVPVPFVLLPARIGGTMRWQEHGRGAGRELQFMGMAAIGLGFLATLVVVVLLADRAHRQDVVIMVLVALGSFALGIPFLILGLRIAATTRVLDISGSQVRLERANRKHLYAHVHVADCSLLVHPVEYRARRVQWTGYAAVIHLGAPGTAERVALAVIKSQEAINRFVEDFRGFGLRVGEGETLKPQLSIGLGVGGPRLNSGRCPSCGYDLLGRFLIGCSECGWGRGQAVNQ